MWEKIKEFFRTAHTIFWARFQVFIGIIIAAVVPLVNDPTVNAAIQAAIQPKYVPFYLIGIGIITELVRRYKASDL